MKQKKLYQTPVSNRRLLRSEMSFCATYDGPTTTYAGEVNDFANIDEVDISSIWDN